VPGARLARVVDVDPHVARSAGDTFGVPWSTNLEAALDDPSIQGFVVATSTSSHGDVIVAAAAAGKHIFTEKPIALDVLETRRATQAVQTAGVLFQVGFHRRFDPDFRALAERVHAGEMGDVHLLRLAHRDKYSRPPGTYLETSGHVVVDSMIHDFDTARWLMGEVATVYASGTAVVDPEFARTGDADHAVAVLEFASGALGLIDNSRQTGYGYECAAELLAAKSSARIAQPHLGYLTALTHEGVVAPIASDHCARHAQAYVSELEAFADCIRSGAESLVPADVAVEAFHLTQVALRSMEEGRPVGVAETRGAGDAGVTDVA
jgi:predicted dehydrogenase